MGRVTIFLPIAGEGHNFFVSVKGEGQNFLRALFKKLVPSPPPLNNDTFLNSDCSKAPDVVYSVPTEQFRLIFKIFLKC